MYSFEVNSNESACRKSGRLGLEQVLCPIYLFPPSTLELQSGTDTKILGRVPSQGRGSMASSSETDNMHQPTKLNTFSLLPPIT